MRTYSRWLLMLSALFFSVASPAFGSDPVKEWEALISKGANYEGCGDYANAIGAFAEAISLTEKGKLPPKCLPISLCRLLRSELMIKRISEAEPYFQRLIRVVQQQQSDGTLSGEVKVWLVDTSDPYMLDKDPLTREVCIKHSCKLKLLGMGLQTESLNALMVLAQYYIDQNKMPNAIDTIERVETFKEKKLNRSTLVDVLFEMASNCTSTNQHTQAIELAKEAIKKVTIDKTLSGIALSPLYALVAMNELAQGKSAESARDFASARREAIKLKTERLSDKARGYFSLLEKPIWLSPRLDKLDFAINNFKGLLEVEEVALDTPDTSPILRLVEAQNAFAAQCERAHNYNQASQLEKSIIKIAKQNMAILGPGLPAFNFCLSENSAIQGNESESKAYFDIALQGCSKVKTASQAKSARRFLEPFEQSIWLDVRDDKLSLAKSKFKELLKIEDAIFVGALEPYGPLKKLADAENKYAIQTELQHKYDQAKQSELLVIKAASYSPALSLGTPAFYLVLSMNARAQGKSDDAKEYSARSLAECARIVGQEKQKIAMQYIDPLRALICGEHWWLSKGSAAFE